MKAIRLTPYFVAAVILGVCLSVYVLPKKSLPQFSLTKSFSTDFAYDQRTFLPAVAKTKKSPENLAPQVVILPHHLLASPLIARGISLLTSSTPDTIVILSPNHLNIGQCDLITSKNSWNTPYGQVEIDQKLLSTFSSSNTTCLDDKNISVEHGIAGLLPFIKYYLPNTKILPIALKKDLDPTNFDNFVNLLISMPKKVVVISSLDFSHYLSDRDAEKKDKVTEKYIKNFNYSEIKKLTSDYLDSPFSLIAALKLIESNQGSLEILDHSQSSVFNGDFSSVTSYFLITGTFSTAPPVILSQPSMSSDSYTLLFGGDVMLGRSVNTQMIKRNDYNWPFRKISDLFKNADLSFINLESPFGSECPPTDTGMIFCADKHSLEGLLFAGIDIVNLANNHISNQSKNGFDLTTSLLSANGIGYIGAGDSVIKSVKGHKIAFIGFNDIPPFPDYISSASVENIKSQIAKAKTESDIVITSFHWGNEYSRRSLHQQELAHLAIDSGADVIIGHHPHWVQEVESYKGKPIYYSLGNLVFDQMWSEETRKGLVIRLTFKGKDLVSEEQILIKIFDYGQPAMQ